MKALDFEINGVNSITIIQGEKATLYFLCKYKDIAEFFYQSTSGPVTVKMRKADSTIASFTGTKVTYFPAIFYVILTAADTAALNPGDNQSIEVEITDSANAERIILKQNALNVKTRLLQ